VGLKIFWVKGFFVFFFVVGFCGLVDCLGCLCLCCVMLFGGFVDLVLWVCSGVLCF